jgi:hypothetical protein
MSLAAVPNLQLVEQTSSSLTLQSAAGYLVHIFVLEKDILRVAVLPGWQV